MDYIFNLPDLFAGIFICAFLCFAGVLILLYSYSEEQRDLLRSSKPDQLVETLSLFQNSMRLACSLFAVGTLVFGALTLITAISRILP